MEALLTEAGYPADAGDLLAAVDAWRGDRMVPAATIPSLARAFIAELDTGTARNVIPHLPEALHEVPRSNVEFLPIKDAWFSGSMNYVGRARDDEGMPRYEATYEINASLEISVPEFAELVSHEVVPGHVTTFAFVQHFYTLGRVGFEGTVLTMNSRYSTLAEGIDHLLSHMERWVAPTRGGGRAPKRLPRDRGKGRKAVGPLGTPPTVGSHVPTVLPCRHREGGAAEEGESSRDRAPRPLWMPGTRGCEDHRFGDVTKRPTARVG